MENVETQADRSIRTTVVIAGGGPAGMMLGLLLARANVDVTVIEKHSDFFRDFRGDTIHPSTLDIVDQLGFIREFLALPHTRAEKLHAEIGSEKVTIADFSWLPVKNRFIAFMPQWDFLNFIAGKAGQFENFRLLMNAPVTNLVQDGGKIRGLTVETPEGLLTIEADLVIGADGRNSIVREKAGLEVERFGVPTEVVWMRLSKQPGDPSETMGHAGPQQGFVLIDRGDYWQCGYVVRKGSYAEFKEKGLDAFRERVAEVCPLPRERLSEIRSWDDAWLLTVRIDRLKQWWKPGLICIGDAAHAMSPIGGVGVNLAIQDAVAVANVLIPVLSSRKPITDTHLAAIENRRSFPTKATQRLQLMMRSKNKKDQADVKKAKGPPAFVLAIMRFPLLAHLAGRLIGLGFRREKLRY
ncbi:2-polyprenyl-6-methoxyphenol hydroxylase-like FAD-dependent oxidoreductase [Rhizobium skierniewicense]|uniref:2-polyprenyl-6-methoxyphenol hydroxylase-like FAD-dependent oxidoreductase n=1 Tax=Rhizobium skierniewicense TaxID=984260 RepID=A0A7W6C5U7_9HYPH|nr:FAD-dependent oxidoreductase [Rhizobium skierniewicense]MBB3946300.1 2-polyprenyl-6-methoxyphenol hydroxylase-like FAD-dependent oxidoreductase [Rhizobium skierniewicense]